MNMIDYFMGALMGCFVTLAVYEWDIFDNVEKLLKRIRREDNERKI